MPAPAKLLMFILCLTTVRAQSKNVSQSGSFEDPADLSWMNSLISRITATCPPGKLNARNLTVTQQLENRVSSTLHSLFNSFRYYDILHNPILEVSLEKISNSAYYFGLHPPYITLIVIGLLCTIAAMLATIENLWTYVAREYDDSCPYVPVAKRKLWIKITFGLHITNIIFMSFVFLIFLVTFVVFAADQLLYTQILQCDIFKAVHDVSYYNIHTRICNPELRECDGTEWIGLRGMELLLQDQKLENLPECPSIAAFLDFVINASISINEVIVQYRIAMVSIGTTFPAISSSLTASIVTIGLIIGILGFSLWIFTLLVSVLSLIPFCCESKRPHRFHRPIFVLGVSLLLYSGICICTMGGFHLFTASNLQNCDFMKYNYRQNIGEGGQNSICIRMGVQVESDACSLLEECLKNEGAWDAHRILKVEDGRTFLEAIDDIQLNLATDMPVCQSEADEANRILDQLKRSGNCGIFNLYSRLAEHTTCHIAHPRLAFSGICLAVLFVCSIIGATINFILHHNHQIAHAAVLSHHRMLLNIASNVT